MSTPRSRRHTSLSASSRCRMRPPHSMWSGCCQAITQDGLRCRNRASVINFDIRNIGHRVGEQVTQISRKFGLPETSVMTALAQLVREYRADQCCYFCGVHATAMLMKSLAWVIKTTGIHAPPPEQLSIEGLKEFGFLPKS